jgi:5-aminopentanamidase
VTRIVCQQLAPRVGDLDGNRIRSTRAVSEAVDLGADVVVLPELVTSGYVFESQAEAAALAIDPSDELFGEWAAQAARGSAIVVGGFCELAEGGRLYNSVAVVDGSGVLGVYRKTHLWDREKLFFEPGHEPPPVFDTPYGRLGVLVCFDVEFPEMPRLLALAGAEVIVVPTNWPLTRRPANEPVPGVIVAMAAAYVNRVFVACCDRTGKERGQEWEAATTIVDPGGRVIARQNGEGATLADVDLELARDKALTDLSDALGDRRPDLYRTLADVPPGSGP